MEKSVRTVFAPHESEKIIEKSRFLTYSEHVESEEEAKAFLAKIRKMHSLATHVCYAFIADKTGNLQRFSDDGEPQGTAGIAKSKGEARRLIEQGGVSVDDDKVSDPNMPVTASEFVLHKGKKVHLKIIVK